MTWVYQEDGALAETGAATAAQITPPSSAELADLLKLTEIGDIMELRRRAERLLQNPALQAFATELKRLAKEIRLEEIRSFVQTYLASPPPPLRKRRGGILRIMQPNALKANILVVDDTPDNLRLLILTRQLDTLP